jgi:drug/metabolite transporter (DMT)-like permease
MVTMMNDLRNFAFYLSITLVGVFTASIGAAILATRELPRWSGWAGLAVGLLCVVSVAVGGGAHNIANLVYMVWWVVLGVLALRHRQPAPIPAARSSVPV